MYQVTPLSDETKREIYMKLTKEEIIDMLLENQRIIETLKPEVIHLANEIQKN